MIDPEWRTRCDWCDWPLAESVDKGCVVDNCSRRPLPELGNVGELKRSLRRAEAEIANLLERYLERGREMDRMLALLGDARADAEAPDARIGAVCPAGDGSHDPLSFDRSAQNLKPTTTVWALEIFNTKINMRLCRQCWFFYGEKE